VRNELKSDDWARCHMEYRIFRPSYTEKGSGSKQDSPTMHVAFRDHLARRQTVAAGKTDRQAHNTAERIVELVECRKTGAEQPDKLRRWVDALPARLRRRLVGMDLIDDHVAGVDAPLTVHLEGVKKADKITTPGYRQALAARGVTEHHVNTSVKRVADVFAGCGFVHWRELAKPAAATRIEVWLGDRRNKGEIGGKTLNYYIREIRSFCKWMADNNRAPHVALAKLKPVKNAAVDSEERRALSIDEMKWLLSTTAAGEDRQGLTGDERALLYRFAFETGIRPKQIRSLTVADFDLKADPPSVTSQAQYVKRRRTHTQVLRRALAAELAERFNTKLPTAPALKLPSKYHMAEMLRDDLADARAAWIKGAPTEKEREERQRSDFLADVSHAGERAVFYSTRHGHGTALADAGVPEKDIAASMHHASRTTTARYLHSGRKSVRSAIDAMPDLAYSQQAIATGTNGSEATSNPNACAAACATGRTPVESGGQNDGSEQKVESLKRAQKRGKYDKSTYGPLAELADAMDSKSLARKGVSVRLR
jgi:integrase